MAGNIRISPQTMRDRAKQYRQEGSTVEQVISNMDNLLNTLQSEWEGEASASYGQRYQELRKSFTAARELIEEIAQALDKTATNMENVDAQIASGFRG